MQGADTIVKTILEDAKAAAAQTLRSADERAQQMRSEAAAAQNDAQEKDRGHIEQEIARRRVRARRMAELEARKAELADKRVLIAQAFDGALEQLCAMDPEKKRALNLTSALEAASGGETFRPAAGDASALDADFLHNVNERLAAAGKRALVMGEPEDGIRGGFLMQGEGVTYNCSYEALINQLRDGLEARVASILFDGASAE